MGPITAPALKSLGWLFPEDVSDGLAIDEAYVIASESNDAVSAAFLS